MLFFCGCAWPNRVGKKKFCMTMLCFCLLLTRCCILGEKHCIALDPLHLVKKRSKFWQEKLGRCTVKERRNRKVRYRTKRKCFLSKTKNKNIFMFIMIKWFISLVHSFFFTLIALIYLIYPDSWIMLLSSTRQVLQLMALWFEQDLGSETGWKHKHPFAGLLFSWKSLLVMFETWPQNSCLRSACYEMR